MRLTILGCGRYKVTSNYNSTGNLVSTDSTHIVLDFGRGNLRALTEQGLSVNDLDAICLSHFHPDHTADVMSAFQEHIVLYKKGISTKQLQFVGPPGLSEWFERLLEMMYEDMPYEPVLHEGEDMEIQIGDLSITTALMHHVIPDIGFRVEHSGKSLFYSGDTGECDSLVELAQAADVAILECSDASGKATEYHLNPESCGKLATQAKVKSLVLTHYGAQERAKELTLGASKYYDSNLVVAQEQLIIDL